MTALVDGGGFTPLHVACAQGNADCVRALPARSHELIPVKAVNSDGRLAIECSEGNANVIRALCANLLQRIATGDEEGVFDLLEGGVDASIDDGGPDEFIMLHWAASFGQSARMVRLLVEHGCSPNQQNKKGQTPLHEASKGGHEEAARALLAIGAALDATDSDGKTPVDVAKSLDFAEALQQWAASPVSDDETGNREDGDELTAAHRRVKELMLIKEENEELVKMLKSNIDTLLEEREW